MFSSRLSMKYMYKLTSYDFVVPDTLERLWRMAGVRLARADFLT